MRKKIDPVVDEAIETLNMKDGPTRRRLLEGAGLFSATAAASALIAACTSSSSSSATPTGGASSSGTAKATAGNFPKTPPWQFWFVNHVTTNLFFVPTQNGMKDAAALLGLPAPKWGGSTTSSATEMVSYLNTAIAAKANGIATTVITATSFTTPVKNAMDAGIPVVSYNADGVVNERRGRHRHQPALLRGPGALQLRRGDGEPDQVPHLEPRRGGHLHRHPGLRQHPAPLRRRHVGPQTGRVHREAAATGALTSAEGAAEKAFLTGAKATLKGAFAVDAGSTQFLGPSLASVGLKIPAGGFDLTPGTLTAINAGQLNFTIDQNPYLQGFLPVMYLYLFNLTGGLVAPPNTDTGLTFVTKSNVGPYLNTKTSYEGSASPPPTLVPRSGPIQNPLATTSV